MKNFEVMRRIERVNHVREYVKHSTIHSSKQALYERMFHANHYTKYEPTFDESQLELLYNYNVHIAITRHSLKRLASKGNLNAMELLNNINHTVSIEDLQQEVLLWFVSGLYDDKGNLLNEEDRKWNISYTGNVTFSSDESMKELFSCISGYLRRFQTKHYKHQYIELDNEIVDCNKVAQLADHVSIDNLLENIELQQFMENLPEFDKKWLELRLEGLSNLAISKELNVSYEKIRACEKRMRKAWNK